jgi:hypothetical protein
MNNDLNANIIDNLGSLLAEIADLTAKADLIKDAMKDVATAPGSTGNVFEGALFKATVIETNRTTIDHKRLLADLGVSAEVIAKYSKTAAVFSVKVGAR